MGILQEGNSEYKIHEIEPGVFGRKIPVEEMEARPEQVEELIKNIGASDALADWVRNLYFPLRPTSLKERVVKLFSRSSPK